MQSRRDFLIPVSLHFFFFERKDAETQRLFFMNTDCTDLRDCLAYARD